MFFTTNEKHLWCEFPTALPGTLSSEVQSHCPSCCQKQVRAAPPPLLAHIRDEGSLGSGKFKVRVEKVVARFAFDSGESVDRTATVGYLTEVLF